MQQKLTQPGIEKPFLTFYFKSWSIFLLLVLSVLLSACSAGANTNTSGDNILNTGSTASIRLGANSSPTPSLAPYWCGAWITRSTVPYDPKGFIALYAKYTHNVDGNPIGVAGAQVQALIQWGDGTPALPIVQTTTSDGLAVFFVPIGDRSAAINKLSLATFTFTAPGASQCEVDNKRPASFVIVPASAAAVATAVTTATATATATPTDPNNGGRHKHH